MSNTIDTPKQQQQQTTSSNNNNNRLNFNRTKHFQLARNASPHQKAKRQLEQRSIKPKVKAQGDLFTNDWGQIIGTIISFTPGIGSLLKTGFGFVWGSIFKQNNNYVTQDQFNDEMSELYEKIEQLINAELDQAEVNRCGLIFEDCRNRGNNFNDLLTLFTDRQQTKKGFKIDRSAKHRVEPPSHLLNLDDDNLLQMIRSQFMDYRDSLEGAIINMSDPSNAKLLDNLLAMTMVLYAAVLRDCCLQGKAWGFPAQYIDGDGNSVKSLKQILHDQIQLFHKNMAYCVFQYNFAVNKTEYSYPAIDLPDNGYKVYGMINELDFIEYPYVVERVESFSPKLFLVPYDGTAKTFKLNIGDSAGVFPSVDNQHDTVSGNQAGLFFASYNDPESAYFTLIPHGTFFGYMSIRIATFSNSDFVMTLKCNAPDFNDTTFDSSNPNNNAVPRACYWNFTNDGDYKFSKIFTSPIFNAGGAPFVSFSLSSPSASVEINSIEVNILPSLSKF
ncbi:hypothetical protein DFA_06911 [Cavenderia fasciculata]|uniref:Pesticidal crystal protein N-terminal domain-containing protein n=1 Tax=Cavenderia fasciculata TaxID=261658 RepID=F4PX06_CACFS|nr:uncharacterized protein DFA_06911 [Cavenderia fasciculata]EGG19809.1 hypothetical protein DFA_06911 [Cavenderia fasciculata]|eukprot:XP_004358155.1 hypothetical protein DFA_06911 [Cavenderia fasciculata]